MAYLRLLLPLLSGLALSASFPGISLYFLAWLGLIPFLFYCLTEKRWWMLLIAHLVFSFFYFGGVLYWIPRVLSTYGGLSDLVSGFLFFLMLIVLSFFLLPFTLLLIWTYRRKGVLLALLCAPGFWILTEVVRNYLAVGGFPWAALAYSQFPYKVIIQCTDIGGVYSLSFLIVLVNSALLALVWQQSIRFGAIVLGIFVIFNGYGIYRTSWWSVPVDGTVRVGLLQGNIGLAGSREYYAEKYYKTLARLFDRTTNDGAALVVIPEAQNPFFYTEDFYFRTFWGSRAKSTGAYVLLNSAAFDKEDRGVYYNSAFLISPTGESTYRYDKNHLVPFGEYLPFKSLLGKFAEPLVREVSSFTPGNDLSPGNMGDIKFGSLICYEGIFPEISRSFVAQGSHLLINITNDAWFGETAAPEQHLQMSALRSVENRRSLLRAANSGYTAIVTPYGEVRHQTSLFNETSIVTEVGYSSYRTFYSYIGDWLTVGLIILCLGICTVDMTVAKKWKEKIRARGPGTTV